MSALILGAAALIAIDRDDPSMIARLRVAHTAGVELRTTGIVVAEVWRDPSRRQSKLARLLKSVDIRAVDDRLGRTSGVLLGRAGRGQAADATIVSIAVAGDRIIASNTGDIDGLVGATGRQIDVLGC
ncbi:MAG: twitching motility protein PilT [Solirubrobacteraceae bacterium]